MVVAGERVEPTAGDLPPWVGFVGPVLIGLVLLAAGVGLARELTTATGWTTTFGERGRFVATACAEEPLRLASRVTCDGAFTGATATEGAPAVLVGPGAAFGPDTPVGGARIEAYHRVGEPSVVYPEQGRSAELARLLLGTLDGLFLVGGAGTWLLGWALTRNIPAEEAERHPYRHRFPLRFGLRRRAARWLGMGALLWIGDRFLLDDLLGTVGLA